MQRCRNSKRERGIGCKKVGKEVKVMLRMRVRENKGNKEWMLKERGGVGCDPKKR